MNAPRLCACLLMLPVLTGSISALAQPPATPYTMARTEVRSMISKARTSKTGTSKADGAYRIYISWPETPPPDDGYPVLYVLDGDDSFPVAAQTLRRLERHGASSGVTPGLVVAIGYPEKSRRALDYTPASASPVDPRGEPAGGAAAFRAFIVDELRPAIEKDFKVDRTRQALMGHSYGGLFVLDTLFTDPGLFQVYVASSPSIWFADRVVLQKEAGLTDLLARAGPRTLVLTVGEHEQTAPGTVPTQRLADRRMVDDNRDLAQRLSHVAHLRLHHRVLMGETHGSAPLPALGNALNFVFGRAAQEKGEK